MAATAPTIHVDIWSDVVCPWCYIGKRRFERAVDELAGEVDIEYVFRAFQLDPTASMGKSQPVAEAYAKKFGGPDRAQAIIERMVESNKTIDLGETLAMALAERGQFAEAVALQRQLMEASIRQGLDAVTKRLAANLLRYERYQPCRVPWTTDDPIHSPGPPVDPGLLSTAPTSAAP